MITEKQIDGIAYLIKKKSLETNDHISFSIRLTGYGKEHHCINEENAVKNSHDGCIDETDFCISYEVFSAENGVCEQHSCIDDAIKRLIEL